MTFEQLQPEYMRRLAAMNLTRVAEAKSTAARLLKNRERFLAVQADCGVPALWIMPVFEREGPNFNAYLGNGDPLNKPTTHVPHGRGPFDSWEAGAADALNFDHVTQCKDWTWEQACYHWELYNGLGPREHGRPSGYLWSGTDQYLGGKYVADGVWSRGTWDKQLGCVLIAKVIAELDPQIGGGFG